MSITRRQFLASGITIVGTSHIILSPFSEASMFNRSGKNFIYADELDWNELPLHDKPFHCSGYPYEIPELDDYFAMSDSYLHDPEIENW